MSLLSLGGVLVSTGNGLAGSGSGVTPAATAPGSVGSLAAGTPGTVSIPVTYTAASGTATITYAGRTALHGSTSFTPNNGTFSATGGQFVGLSAGTAYDLQIVATNGAGSSVTTLLNIATNSAPVVSTPSGRATRYDVLFDQSVVAVGATATGKLVPNGLWFGGTVTLTPTAGSTSTITLPTNGNAAVSFSFTVPSIGDDYFTPTNDVGLYDPWVQQINVFSGSSGTSRTFGAALAGTAPDMRTYQRDTASGTPNGFPNSFNRGWGQVQINVTSLSGATDGLWVRLYDARSSGASGSVGSGTPLHSSPVQVHGSMGASGSISALLPASASIYYADIATDAAFSAPVRIAQRFRVGVVIGHMSRSQETGLERDYAGAANGMHLAQFYSKTATWAEYDHRYANTDSGWFLQDGGTDPYQYHYSEPTSSGPQEIGRLLEAQLGVCVGITGVSDTGGGLDVFFNHDGSLASGFDATVSASVGRKFRYLWVAMGGWDGVDGNYPNETFDESRGRMIAAVPKLATAYAACAVIGWVSGASGWFGDDGSRDAGYTRLQNVMLSELEPSNPMVVSKESTLWNDFYGNHATQIARLDYIRPGFRLLMAAELAAMGGYQSTDRGPTLASTGSLSGRTIRLPYTLHGGSSLTSVVAVYSNPGVSYRTASTSELAPLFSVYAGPNGRKNAGTPVKIDSATINASAGTIDIVLSGSSGITMTDNSTAAMPASFTVHYGADFGASAARLPDGTGASLCDDRNDGLIPYGWLMRPKLDIAVS